MVRATSVSWVIWISSTASSSWFWSPVAQMLQWTFGRGKYRDYSPWFLFPLFFFKRCWSVTHLLRGDFWSPLPIGPRPNCLQPFCSAWGDDFWKPNETRPSEQFACTLDGRLGSTGCHHDDCAKPNNPDTSTQTKISKSNQGWIVAILSWFPICRIRDMSKVNQERYHENSIQNLLANIDRVSNSESATKTRGSATIHVTCLSQQVPKSATCITARRFNCNCTRVWCYVTDGVA